MKIYRSWFPSQNEKDNFHTPILSIDKTIIFDIVVLPIQQNFLFPEGGGGWRKTLKIPSEIICSEKLTPGCYLRSKYI